MNARNVGIIDSVRWILYFINSVDKIQLFLIPPTEAAVYFFQKLFPQNSLQTFVNLCGWGDRPSDLPKEELIDLTRQTSILIDNR